MRSPGLLTGRLTALGLAVLTLTAPLDADAAAHRSATIRPSDGTYTVSRTYTALGDSIAAGYCGWFCSMKAYTEYYGGYIANQFDAQVSYRGRAHSGYLISDIYAQAYEHRADIAASEYFTVEGCGNDYLDARSDFRASSCDTSIIDQAAATCQSYLGPLYDRVKSYAPTGRSFRAVAMTLYYPGINTDRSRSCGGQTHFDHFLPYIAEGNWFTCYEAELRGFKCADAFAEFHGADYDSDGNGQVDTEQLRYRTGESLDAYVARIVANKAIIRDANQKRTSSTTTADYLQSDDVHPTAAGHARLGLAHHRLGYGWVTKP